MELKTVEDSDERLHCVDMWLTNTWAKHLSVCQCISLFVTSSRSTVSLLMFSGGAEGLVVELGGHVK